MMTLYNIQTLIKQGKIVDVANLDPTESYLELAVYQEGNRKIGPGNANSYPSYAISLKDLIDSAGGGTSTTPSITVPIDLNTSVSQSVITIPDGSYIVEKVYISQASIDLSASPVRELIVSNSGVVVPAPWNSTGGNLFTTLDAGPCPPPGCDDLLNTLSIPQMYATLYAVEPVCFPPPCNAYVITGGETLNVTITTPTGVPATAQLHVVIRKIG